MGESAISQWKSTLEDLAVDLRPASSTDDRSWFEVIAEFSRHSFARLLVGPTDSALTLRLEIALGPSEESQRQLGQALAAHLGSHSETTWQLESEESPWQLETSIQRDRDQAQQQLADALRALLAICDQFGDSTTAADWFELLDASHDGPAQTSASASTSTKASPFETIGSDSNTAESGDPPPESNAAIEATALQAVDTGLHVGIGFPQVLSPQQIQALHQGLEHHLHNKFDVQVRPIDRAEHSEANLGSSTRTALYIDINPGQFPGSADDLEAEIEDFLTRLEKFSAYGVDLFEYLGVGETVLESSTTDSPSEQSQLSFRRPSPPRSTSRAADSDGVVLDLSGDSAETGSTVLRAKNYTDPRLQREDASTPLVDLVLRHPGYSDRRIGQVLSIILSIDYHDAIEIADAAPCVIAWGVGQKRARSFKDVIESAGGKILLVEPGTFGQS